MTKSVTDVVATIVKELTPFTSEERHRVIQASLTLLGEVATNAVSKIDGPQGLGDGSEEFAARARIWMKQNGISSEQIHQVFHVSPDGVEVIAAEIPGNINRDKVRNAYILTGIARLLASGEPKFDDASARELCESSGFYDRTNHAKFMKVGNEFTGSKGNGWVLTNPGLKRGAMLVTELSKQPAG